MQKFKKVWLHENILWPDILNHEVCRTRRYCFSSEDGWSIQWTDDSMKVLSVYNGRQFFFPMASIAWIEG